MDNGQFLCHISSLIPDDFDLNFLGSYLDETWDRAVKFGIAGYEEKTLRLPGHHVRNFLEVVETIAIV